MKTRPTSHLHQANETYFQHLRFALSYARRLALASSACFIHALFPCFFQTTASSIIKNILDDISKRYKKLE